MITCETPSVAGAEVIRGTVDVKAEGIGEAAISLEVLADTSNCFCRTCVDRCAMAAFRVS